jgi:hypothetical protein
MNNNIRITLIEVIFACVSFAAFTLNLVALFEVR